MSEWISIKDKLPEAKERVLCYYKYEPESPDVVCENTYMGNGLWMSEMSKVTHWMPLPVAPAKEMDVTTLEERVEKVIKLCNKKMHRFDILSKVATTCGRLEDFKKNFDLFMIYGNIKGILEGEIEIDEC